MRLSFLYPSSVQRTGGVTVLYEFANGLARRDHDVQFIHGPRTEYRVERLADIPFRFDERIRHRLVDEMDSPAVHDSQIVFVDGAPDRLGLPCVFVQGHQMLAEQMEIQSFRAPIPKVCIAKWLVDVGLGLGVPARQLWHVPLGVRHDVFTDDTPQDRRSWDVAALYHPHRNKGWDIALATLHELHERRADLRSIVFGMERPPEPMPTGTDFVLAPDHRALAKDVYNQTRVFLQASRVEGFGYTPVEAMACGAALVTTDNGGSKDYAVDGRTALVAPIEDTKTLAHAVARLLDDDQLRTRLAKAGSEHVRRFDWDVSAAILEQRLQEYLGDPAGHRGPPAPLIADPDDTTAVP